MNAWTPRQWREHLLGVAEPHLDRAAFPILGALADPFALVLTGHGVIGSAGSAPAGATGEIALWWARAGRAVDVDAVLATPADGPLFPRDAFRAIEVWTDAELSALHALWWLAETTDRADWRARVATLRSWHRRHTQPDNATNRPWALHAFALDADPESQHYAATLLHNCTALSGRPDPVSAWILLDAARALALGVD